MCTKLANEKHEPIDQDAARTLDGQRPIGTAKPWISPRRPRNKQSGRVLFADAADDFYCPDCDWQQYYCLCAAATSVDGAEYREMAARRAQETGLYGFEQRGRERRGLRATVEATTATTKDDEEKKTDDDGASSAGRSQVVSAAGGDGSVGGRTMAVDEGGDGRSSAGAALEGEIALVATSPRGTSAGRDDGRTSVGRQQDEDDVLVMRRPTTTTSSSWQTMHAGDWTDEELAEFADSFDAGDVRVCCQWTAHRRYTQEDEDDMEANPHRWERKCCVWIRRGPSSLLGKRRPPSSSSSSSDEEEEDDEEDWTEPWQPDEVPDDDPKPPKPDVVVPSEPLAVKLERRPYRSPYAWRSPNVGGILYTTTTAATTTPRRSRRLSTKEEADWRRRAQEAIDDEEALDERIREAEEELKRRVDVRVECEGRLKRLSLQLPKRRRRRVLVRSRYFATSGKTATRRQPKKKTTK